MEFNKKIQDKFKKIGWNTNRNVLLKYSSVKYFDEFPQFLKNFLKEYGDIIIDDEGLKRYKSEVINELSILPVYAEYEEDEDYESDMEKVGKRLYPFAYFEPDLYYIACDEDGKVYMLGDYIFHIANSLKDGIEILLQDDWSKGYLELNEETGIWKPSESYSGWND